MRQLKKVFMKINSVCFKYRLIFFSFCSSLTIPFLFMGGLVNAQPVNAQPVNAQPVNTQSVYTQSIVSKSVTPQTVTPQSILQTNCTMPSQESYRALILATGLNQVSTVKKITSMFCFDYDKMSDRKNFTGIESPIFYVGSQEMLSFYLPKMPYFLEMKEKSQKMDMLSWKLVSEFSPALVMKKEKKVEAISLLSKYDPMANISWFDNKFQTLESKQKNLLDSVVTNERRAIIKIITDKMAEKTSLPTDSFKNNAATYALLVGNADVFERLTASVFGFNFYRLNNSGFSLFHLAFAPQKGFTVDKVSRERMNDIIAKAFFEKRINNLQINEVSFPLFLEIMRDSNEDLYQKIKAKLSPKTIIPIIHPNTQSFKKREYTDAMEYISVIASEKNN